MPLARFLTFLEQVLYMKIIKSDNECNNFYHRMNWILIYGPLTRNSMKCKSTGVFFKITSHKEFLLFPLLKMYLCETLQKKWKKNHYSWRKQTLSVKFCTPKKLRIKNSKIKTLWIISNIEKHVVRNVTSVLRYPRCGKQWFSKKIS